MEFTNNTFVLNIRIVLYVYDDETVFCFALLNVFPPLVLARQLGRRAAGQHCWGLYC